MRSFRKMVAGILGVALAASSSAAFAVIPEDVKGTRYEEPIQILAALGIMNGDDDGSFRPDDTIIRAEVAKMAIHALGLEDAAAAATNEKVFPDVAEGYWASGYINLANSMGLVIGDDQGNFRPYDKITYQEAMTIMVRALGYEPLAESKGGYPQGYVVVGTNNNLNKNVTGSTTAEISRGNVAYMTVNALNAFIMEQSGFGNNIQYEVTDKTILEDVLGVTVANGQISAISTTSLNGTSNLNEGQVLIDGEVYETAYNINNLFAHNVTYYYKENSDSKNEIILAIEKAGANSSKIIEADLFEGIVDNNVIEYYENADSTRVSKANLDAEITMIYNGKHEATDYELLNMNGRNGYVKLLDTDKNGKFDIAFVNEYYNLVVEEVTTTGKIVDKYGAPTLKLDDEDIYYNITKGLETIELKDLKEFDVLSVAESKDGELIDIIVSEKTIEGRITGTDGDGYVINGGTYEVADNFTESLSIGTEGVFYLDCFNKISAMDTQATFSSNYAYLIKAYTSYETEESTFRVFTKSGEEKTFTAASKIRFNGRSGYTAESVVDELTNENGTIKQLVTYSTNSDGKLTSINTAADESGTGKINTNKFTLNYALTNQSFNATTGKLGKVNVTEDTIVFEIPENSDEYKLSDSSIFEDGSSYNVLVYDMGEDYTAKVVIVTNAALSVTASAPAGVVAKVTSAVNDDDDVTDMLTVYVDGKKHELYAEDEGLLTKSNGKALAAGDIIQYSLNADGEIASFRLLFDVDEKGTEKEVEHAENLVTVYGKVVKKFASSMNVSVNGGEVMNIGIPSDAVIYSVDTGAKNKVTVATAGDIQAYDEDEGNRVFVKMYKDVVTEIVVVK